MDVTALIEQWLPAAYKAARWIAAAYCVTRQQRADLDAAAPAALWLAIRDGTVSATTPAAWVVLEVRTLLWNAPAELGFKMWLPDAYRAKIDGKRSIQFRRVADCTSVYGVDAYGCDSVTANLPTRPARAPGDDTDAVIDELARCVAFTAWELSALRLFARGNGSRVLAARKIVRTALLRRD